MSTIDRVESTKSKPDSYFFRRTALGESHSYSRGALGSVREKETQNIQSEFESDIVDNNYSVEQRIVELLVSKLAEVLKLGKNISELEILLARLVLETRNLSLILLGSLAEDKLQALARTFEMSWEELQQEESLRVDKLHEQISALIERNSHLERAIEHLEKNHLYPDSKDSNQQRHPASSHQTDCKIQVADIKLATCTNSGQADRIFQLTPVRLESFFQARSLFVLQGRTSDPNVENTVLFTLRDSSQEPSKIEVYKKTACDAQETSLVRNLVGSLHGMSCQGLTGVSLKSINLESGQESKYSPEPLALLQKLFTNQKSLQQPDLPKTKKINPPSLFCSPLWQSIEKPSLKKYDYDNPPTLHPDLLEASIHLRWTSQSDSNGVSSGESLPFRGSRNSLGFIEPFEEYDYDTDRHDNVTHQISNHGSLSLSGSPKKIRDIVQTFRINQGMQPRLRLHLELDWINTPVYCLKYNKDSSFKSNRNNMYFSGGTAVQDLSHHRFFFLKSTMDTLLESQPKITLKNATLPVLDVYSSYEYTVVAQGNLEQGGLIFLAYPKSSNWHQLKYQFLTYYQVSLAVEGKRRLRYNKVIHFSANSFVFISNMGSLVWVKINPKSSNYPKEELVPLKVGSKEHIDLVSFNYPHVVFSTSAGRVMSTNLLNGTQSVFPQTFNFIMDLVCEKKLILISAAVPGSRTMYKGKLHFLEFKSGSFSHLRTAETSTHLSQLTIISESKASKRRLVAGLPRRGNEFTDNFQLYDFAQDPPMCVADYKDWWSGGLVYGICQVENFLLLFGERTGAKETSKSSVAILEI